MSKQPLSSLVAMLLALTSVALASAQTPKPSEPSEPIALNRSEPSGLGLVSVESPFLVALSVENIQKTQSFYVEVLGFRIKKPAAELAPGVLFSMLERDGFHLELIGIAGSKARKDVLPKPENSASLQGFFKLGFLVPSVDVAAKALTQHGIKLLLDPMDDEANGLRFLLFQDPDGNVIQLFQKLEPKTP